jgi:hypothetical protein
MAPPSGRFILKMDMSPLMARIWIRAPHEPQPEDGESDDVDDDEVNLVSTSQDDVRRLARVRVYNMAYSHPSRAYRPFLPPDTTRLGSPSNAVPPVPPIPDTNLDLDSVDLPPLLDDGGGDNDNDEQGTGEESDVVANGQYPSSIGLSGTVRHAKYVHSGVVQGGQLPRFDRTWIAAVH